MYSKNLISSILLFLIITYAARAQEKPATNASPDEINKAMLKLFEYYESYEDGSTPAQRNAKFDNAFDALTRGGANSKDKNDAFKMVDAYIKADQNPSGGNESNGSSNDFIKKTDEYKRAEKAINEGFNRLTTMSYPDFEKTMMQLKSTSGLREIKETYNKMHTNDGKQVAITAADDELTPQQQMLWAIKAIENPKDYEEFAKAAKILNPRVTNDKLRQSWAKHQSK
jgi:hypothetical protein